jgi:mediator of RNA polymerase II transcription subunit 8
VAPTPGSRQQRAAGPAVPLEDILRYMTTGIPPTQR